jgi:hypothetical protein
MVEFRSVEQTDGSGPVKAESDDEFKKRNTAGSPTFFLSFLFFVQVKGIPFDATDPEVSGKDLFR